ncbi:helix-turn-helix domain-containing protein [Burkholderia sp. AU19243]|nr:helix-turn-helix domain-containing protein [Burkholderia vietnamiensis]MBR8366379.1 helix-turn-helix domain-containing protein [Burkholderia sp. AU19243]
MRKYKHLSAEERSVIMIEHRNGSSTRAIALRLGRSASTVSRELARNGDTAIRRRTTMRRGGIDVPCSSSRMPPAAQAVRWQRTVSTCASPAGLLALVAAADCCQTSPYVSRRS